MASYNKVLLMGNLTRDPELRYTANNHPVASIGLACNRVYTSGGEKKEEVTFVECDAWGRTAEIMNQYLSKGRPVFIEGRLRLDTWTDQAGKNHSRLKVVIDSFQFIDSKGGGGGGRGRGGDSSQSRPAHGAAADGPHQPLGDDDIPF